MSNFSVYKGKKIAIMGLGRSTLALAKLLHSHGVTVALSDMNPKDNVAELAKELGALAPQIEAEFGKHTPALFLDATAVVVAPGVRLDTKPLDEVQAAGIPIMGEVEFLAQEIEAPTMAFLGTEGKTTIAFLVKAFLEAGGKTVFYSGDHGEPLANFLLKGSKADYVLLELSPYQLESVQKFRPFVTVLSSLQPPFPERFPSAEAYGQVVRNVLRNLTDKNFLVYNFRDANLKALIAGNASSKRVYRRKDPASLGAEIASLYKGAWLASSGRELIWKEGERRSAFNLRGFKLYGLHNRDNLMAAVNVAKIAGVSDEAIQKTIDSFPGVPHRLEFVKKKGGVRLINDSRATTVDALRLALDSFPLDPIILVAGGRDAQADFAALSELVKSRVKTLVLVGEAKEHINRCLGDFSETFLVGTFEEAVLLSYQKSREGDIILLSPGCESYDMFVSYEERGNYFRKYVEEI